VESDDRAQVLKVVREHPFEVVFDQSLKKSGKNKTTGPHHLYKLATNTKDAFGRGMKCEDFWHDILNPAGASKYYQFGDAEAQRLVESCAKNRLEKRKKRKRC
jgi:hypothetical protein